MTTTAEYEKAKQTPPPKVGTDDYTCPRDFPGWADLTSEQKGHVADIEVAAYWRGYNDGVPPGSGVSPPPVSSAAQS